MPATRRIKKRGVRSRKMRGGNTEAFLKSYLKGRDKYSDRAIEEGVKAGIIANTTARRQLSSVGQQPKGFDLSSKTSKIVQNVAIKVANEVKQREDIARQAEAVAANMAKQKQLAKQAAAEAAAAAAVRIRKMENTNTLVKAVRGKYQTKRNNLQRELNRLTYEKEAENRTRKPSFFGRFLGRSPPVSNTYKMRNNRIKQITANLAKSRYDDMNEINRRQYEKRKAERQMEKESDINMMNIAPEKYEELNLMPSSSSIVMNTSSGNSSKLGSRTLSIANDSFYN